MSKTTEIEMLKKRYEAEKRKSEDRGLQVQLMIGKVRQYEAMAARLSTMACALALRLQPLSNESVHLITREQLEKMDAYCGEVRETEDGGMVFSVHKIDNE